jgi:hypothetical protein
MLALAETSLETMPGLATMPNKCLVCFVKMAATFAKA